MQFHGFHGVHDFEAEQGGTFRVDVEISMDLDLPGQTDQIEDTLDYEEAYDIISREMSVRSSLLEHVGARIRDSLMKRWDQISQITVKISKNNPPLEGKIAATSVVMEGKR